VPRITRPARPAAPARGTSGTIGARALAFVRRLPDHSLTDRLVRGRAWIPVLGVLLVGIVALQVSILRLNASMGRAIEQSTTLQTKNGELRAQVASLGSVARIERIASAMGMAMATPAQISFLSPGAGGARARAIANMTAPTSAALGVAQAAASTAATATTGAASTAATTTSATSTSGTSAPPTTGSPVSTPPTASTPAAGTYPATGGTAPAGASPTGATPTGAAATQPAAGAVTGAATPAQQSSGGASSAGAGG
jgi:cell division protein FtsL